MMPGLSYGSSKTDMATTGPQTVIGGGTVPVYVWFIVGAVAIFGLILWSKKK